MHCWIKEVKPIFERMIDNLMSVILIATHESCEEVGVNADWLAYGSIAIENLDFSYEWYAICFYKMGEPAIKPLVRRIKDRLVVGRRRSV